MNNNFYGTTCSVNFVHQPRGADGGLMPGTLMYYIYSISTRNRKLTLPSSTCPPSRDARNSWYSGHP
ncbi:hypothetical protein RIF29_18425 [Crotalaria pallida]|uniref:Uncharacterized protein n=1 Tax=Crotalaria pallida TaxID=3830 RepID=A0AAN9FJ10_CROPI